VSTWNACSVSSTILKPANTTIPRPSSPNPFPTSRTPPSSTARVPASRTLALDEARRRFADIGLKLPPESAGSVSTGPDGTQSVSFDEQALRRIGILLYPRTAYGVLNGGSASSYADVKKNRALDPSLFEKNRALFDTLAGECRGKPKGITPAFINPDGSPGFSFLYLKLRMLLEHKKMYRDETGSMPSLILPAFQMTSVHTDAAIMDAFREYVMDPGLHELSLSLGCPSIEIYTESQTMMAAITHSSEGKPRCIFDRAWGKPDTGLAMPGGHGQNFEILAPVYRKLRDQGIRYAWLGNIDNMGYTVDPVSLALFALSGKEAAFEASYRTPFDVKGGILVTDSTGRVTCADIGAAISGADVHAFEAAGKTILFNCGVGLFDLDRLVPRLGELPFQLPLRISDQDKDAGLYAQAEQITWEIIGLLDDPLFFAVPKTRRFIAAKMLMETLLTSLPPAGSETTPMKDVSLALNRGLVDLFAREYGLVRENGRWVLRSENI